MKAISTKYLGPTNFRGSRVKATDHDGNAVTISWDSARNSEENHRRAVAALCIKMMDWHGTLVGGHSKDGMVWVWFHEYAPTVPNRAAGYLVDHAPTGKT